DADAQAVARVEGRVGRILAAVVGVDHTVAVDALFLPRGVSRLAAPYRPFGEGFVGHVPFARPVAGACAEQRAGHGCSVIAAPAAELVANDTTDDGPDDRAARVAGGAMLDRVGAGLLPALLYGRSHRHVTHVRLHAQDARIIIDCPIPAIATTV